MSMRILIWGESCSGKSRFINNLAGHVSGQMLTIISDLPMKLYIWELPFTASDLLMDRFVSRVNLVLYFTKQNTLPIFEKLQKSMSRTGKTIPILIIRTHVDLLPDIPTQYESYPFATCLATSETEVENITLDILETFRKRHALLV